MRWGAAPRPRRHAPPPQRRRPLSRRPSVAEAAMPQLLLPGHTQSASQCFDHNTMPLLDCNTHNVTGSDTQGRCAVRSDSTEGRSETQLDCPIDILAALGLSWPSITPSIDADRPGLERPSSCRRPAGVQAVTPAGSPYSTSGIHGSLRANASLTERSAAARAQRGRWCAPPSRDRPPSLAGAPLHRHKHVEIAGIDRAAGFDPTRHPCTRPPLTDSRGT